MQYLTQHPSKRAPKKGLNASYVCRWSIAAGKRPVPFRTRKLSLHTLMVLQPGGCGRVSHRRHQTTTNNSIIQKGRRRSTTVSFPFFAFYRATPHTTVLGHTHLLTVDPMELRTPVGKVAGNEPQTSAFTPAPYCDYCRGSADQEWLGDFPRSTRK